MTDRWICFGRIRRCEEEEEEELKKEEEEERSLPR